MAEAYGDLLEQDRRPVKPRGLGSRLRGHLLSDLNTINGLFYAQH